MSLPDGYTLHVGVPSVSTYLHLRQTAGLSARTPEQAIAALQGSWTACYVVWTRTPPRPTTQTDPSLSAPATAPNAPDPEIVAMGRVLGDGAWYFVVADMAVHPLHQRRGLGDVMLKHLLREIQAKAPPGQPYVCLSADAAGRRLYARNGFVETAPQSVGMVWRPG